MMGCGYIRMQRRENTVGQMLRGAAEISTDKRFVLDGF